jgi:succinate-semialdehyde dehydrogenase/glutarate-semialdehyde dehydrogenase
VATQRLMRIAPAFGLSDETYARVMTTSLRMMKRMGRA